MASLKQKLTKAFLIVAGAVGISTACTYSIGLSGRDTAEDFLKKEGYTNIEALPSFGSRMIYRRHGEWRLDKFEATTPEGRRYQFVVTQGLKKGTKQDIRYTGPARGVK